MPANDPILLQAIRHFDQIGKVVNSLATLEPAKVKTTLQLILQNTGEVLPGSSALLAPYDSSRGEFDRASLITFGSFEPATDEISHLTQNMGAQALLKQQRILSYENQPLDIHPLKESAEPKTLACFPLIVSGEPLGVYCVRLEEERCFTGVELLLMENFANLASMTLSMARQFAFAQQEQLRKERELRRLRRAGVLISSRSSLKETLETILRMALEVTDARYGIFRLVDPGGENLVTQAIAGEGLESPAVEILPISDRSIMGYVATHREPIIISDLRTEIPWKDLYYPLDHLLEMRSELAVPLIGASGRLEGVLNLESPLVNAFSKQDRYILQILATQAVVAIQEVRLLDALQDISALHSTGTLQQVHQALVERACDLLNVPNCLIWLVENNHLFIQASSDPALCGVRVLISAAGNTGQVVNTSQVIAALDARLDEVLIQEEFSRPEFSVLRAAASALIVPIFAISDIRGESSPIGAISVYTASGDLRDFNQSEWDKKVLTILAHYAAQAVQETSHLDALRIAQDQRATTETFAAIGDIAANLMHRLNNKIGTIPVRVEGIQDKCEAGLLADPYLAGNLNEIQRSATEAMEIVRDSLAHLRPIELAPVSVAASVKEALASIALPGGVYLECCGLDDLPPVQAGANRLALVFSNLLENAVDAMDGKGSILIQGFVRDRRWVEIQVSDSGPGIAPDLHERIFELNYSSRTASRPGKLGFGLWWVKSLTTRFGGTVSVESDGFNGTTFTLTLPLAKGDA